MPYRQDIAGCLAETVGPRGVTAGEQFVAAFSLAFDGKLGGGGTCKCPRHVKQSCFVAVLEFKFGLV